MKKRLPKFITHVNDADLTELNMIISFAGFVDCHKKDQPGRPSQLVGLEKYIKVILPY